MKPLLNKPDGGKLEISLCALSCMLAFTQNAFYKREAGGVLRGRYIYESFDIVIDKVTVPMLGDRRRRNSFHRARLLHQNAIDQAWQDSGGTCTYLGEWHTHPERNPVPSDIDLTNWGSRLRDDIFSGEMLYFIIVGTKHLRVWEGSKGTLTYRLIGELVV
jgi:integrative and conjugative element protein (TIGR02256 family)